MTTVALLPSALLGPAVWAPVHAILSTLGRDVLVADGRASSTADVLQRYLDDLPAGREYILVPHSNAGLYVPAIAQRRSVTRYVFVDAVLPPRSGSVPVASEGLQAVLRDLADADAMLPPWTRWWSEQDVAALFPSDRVRAHVAAEQRRLPMSYFEETIAVEPGWADTPGSYVAFGDTYEVERTQAEGWGWHAEVLAGDHLHMLRAPEETAAAIERALI